MERPDRRRMLAWLVSALLAAAVPSDAALGQDTGADDAGSASQSEGGGSSGEGSAGGETSSGGTGEGGSTTEPTDPAPTEPAAPPDSTAPETPAEPDAGTIVDQEAALKAVEEGHALPLRSFVRRIEQKYGGEVIDAALQKVGRSLFYRLKMLSPGGRVFVVSVEAATGRPQSGSSR